jgi:hypothetical protein
MLRLVELIEQFDAAVAAREAKRSTAKAASAYTRSIMHEQDRAYQEALAQDLAAQRARALKSSEAKRVALAEQAAAAQKLLAEQKELAALEQLAATRLAKRARLPEEPSAAAAAAAATDVINLCIRLPDGQRVKRRFRGDDTLGNLCDFVESHELSTADGCAIEPAAMQTGYELVSSFPRKTFSAEPRALTLRAIAKTLSCGSQLLLIVEPALLDADDADAAEGKSDEVEGDGEGKETVDESNQNSKSSKSSNGSIRKPLL